MGQPGTNTDEKTKTVWQSMPDWLKTFGIVLGIAGSLWAAGARVYDWLWPSVPKWSVGWSVPGQQAFQCLKDGRAVANLVLVCPEVQTPRLPYCDTPQLLGPGQCETQYAKRGK